MKRHHRTIKLETPMKISLFALTILFSFAFVPTVVAEFGTTEDARSICLHIANSFPIVKACSFVKQHPAKKAPIPRYILIDLDPQKIKRSKLNAEQIGGIFLTAHANASLVDFIPYDSVILRNLPNHCSEITTSSFANCYVQSNGKIDTEEFNSCFVYKISKVSCDQSFKLAID